MNFDSLYYNKKTLRTTVIALLIVSALLVPAIAEINSTGTYFWISPTDNIYADEVLRVGDSLRIGVLGPFAWMSGQGLREGATLAAEEINATGGILEDNVTLVFADTLQGQQYPNNETGAAAAMELMNAGCDFVIGGYWSDAVFAAREVFMDYEKIFLVAGAADDELINEVSENYTRYKYLFRVAPVNLTTTAKALWNFSRFVLESKLLPYFEVNGQVNVAVVSENLTLWDEMHENMTNPTVYNHTDVLGPYANVTYSVRVSVNETDFSEVLGNVSAHEARLIIHLFSTQAGINFTKQWAESGVEAIPVGINVEAQKNEFWEETEGKCEYETILAPSGMRTPLSAKALAFHDETFLRYGHAPLYTSWGAYEAIFTLAEAVERAGTTDSDAVVTELEQTDRNTTLGRFKFTECHDVFCNEIGEDWEEGYVRPLIAQWQKSPMTGKARLNVVWPRDQVYSKKWKIPTIMSPIADFDLNGDGHISLADLGIMILVWNGFIGGPEWGFVHLECDFDGNGIINIIDWNKICLVYAGIMPGASQSQSMVTGLEGSARAPRITQTNHETTVYLDPPTINGTSIGEEFRVNITIRDALDITAWQAGLAFNATLLNCTEFWLGDFFTGGLNYVEGEIHNDVGVVDYMGCTFSGNASGNGTLAYATFEVIETGVSDVHLRDVMVLDPLPSQGGEDFSLAPFNIVDTYTVARSAAQTVFTVSNSTGVDTDPYNYEFVNDTAVPIVYGSGFYSHVFSDPDEEISFNVTGPYSGFSNVSIPKTLIEVDFLDQWLVIVDDIPLKTEERTVTENATHYFVYFNYTLGIHNIRILKRPPVHNIDANRYYATIQDAIRSAQSGHTILAYAGTHYENVVVNKTVSLVGENKYNTTIDGSGTGTVINVTANNVNISGFTVRNSGNPKCGILVDGSSGNNISHNIISDNTYGICLYQSSDTNLTNNTMSGNKYNFGLYGAEGSHFSNAIDESNTVDGKPVYYVKKASNTVYDSSTNAGTFYLIDCTNVTIKDLTLRKNVNGIFFWNTTNSKIQNVNTSNNLNGIYLQGQSNHNNLTDNTVLNNELGIYLQSCNNNIIYHNSFIENTIQAEVTESIGTLWNASYSSGGNYWSDHSITYPFVVDEYKGENQNEEGNDGIIDDPKIIGEENQDNYPLASPLTPPVYNIHTHLGYTKIQEAINAFNTSNGHMIIVRAGTYSEQVTINKSLILIGIIGSTIINGTETVVTITANDVTLRGFTIQGTGSSTTDKGILLSHSNNTIINKNTLSKKGNGIYLDDSDSCSISGNTLNNNTVGIYLQSSDSVVISRNTLTSARENSRGIVLDYSSDNDIHRNNVTYNIVGIKLWSSSNNTIYHNNFINNTVTHADVEPLGYINTWDDGYPSGGNYWSDYEDRYPDAEEIDESGLWNTSYVIDANNQDNYPLMSQRIPQHDVAVVSIAPALTYEEYPVTITVIVENQGDHTEKFNVTTYYNDTHHIATQTITVTSESLTPITFTWNTTGVSCGNYTLTANVTIVPSETDTADNTYLDGWVEIRLWGDVNGDGEVKLSDVAKLDKIFSGWIPGPPYIDPKTGKELLPDINGDGKVKLSDVAKLDLIFSGHL